MKHDLMDIEQDSTAEAEKKEESLRRLSDWLINTLKFCSDHKRKNYSDDWETYDRMTRGVYKNAYSSDNKDESWKCQIYYNIAEQKRLSAVAQIDDAISSHGVFPFALKATPEGETDSEVNKAIESIGVNMDEAMTSMEVKMKDNLEESKSLSEIRKSVHDCSKYGVGIIHSPDLFMGKSRSMTMNSLSNMPDLENEDGVLTPNGEKERDQWLKDKVIPNLKITDKERIGMRRIRPADIFPDPACEGDAQRGFGLFERNHYSIATLRSMADEFIMVKGEKTPKYENKEILKVLKREYSQEYDRTAGENTEQAKILRNDTESDDTDFRGVAVYTFYGDILKIDVSGSMSGPSSEKEQGADLSDYDMESVIIDFTREGEVLRVIKNPHPSGKRPIHLWQWEKVDGEWVGKGIHQKLRDLQAEMNRFICYWVDNKLLSSSVVLGVLSEMLDRGEGEDLTMYPGKIIYLRSGQDVRMAIQQLEIRDVSDSFLSGMYRLSELIDYESGVPKIIEGQGSTSPKTAFETQQQEAHALKQLGSVIKNLDETMDDSLEMIYQHILVYGDGKGAIIGDFKVMAKGYSSFEDRRMRMAELDSMIQMSIDPTIGVHFDKRKLIEDKIKLIGAYTEQYMVPIEEVQAQMKAQADQQQEQIQIQMQMDAQKAQEEGKIKLSIEEHKAQLAMHMKEIDVNEADKDRSIEVSEGEKDRTQKTETQLMDFENEENSDERNKQLGPAK